jgi:asparagine synthase (glutamine-hydrolysing)
MIAGAALAQTSGIYALARIDGGTVDSADAGVLGIPVADPTSCVARGVDSWAVDGAAVADDGHALTILVGYIAEPAALARRFNQPDATMAQLARAALAQFGSDMPAIVVGEWSLLHFERPGKLTLMMSAARRDRIFYATSGPLIAVAPDLFRLSRLPWVGRTLDEAGLLFGLGRGPLRGSIGERTMLERVRQVEPGSSVTFTGSSILKSRSEAFDKQPRWQGSFDDAMAEADALMRDVLAERLERTASPSIMLSGGLDSSLLACIAAEVRRKGQPLLLLTSVAPPGSGLQDEAAVADSVAAHLGLEAEHLWPAEDANIYRPPDVVLSGASGPPLATRHCLTATFQRVGRARGATMLLDGSWGEMTLSGYAPYRGAQRYLRRASAWMRRALAAPEPSGGAGAFHVRLSRERTAALPETIRSHLAHPESDQIAAQADLWGFQPGAVKALRHANEFYGGAIRVEFPYRDLRLLRLFAGFPTGFMNNGGLQRAPARQLMKGRLPDAVRLRTRGGPASPDHLQRMQRQALSARERIAHFRKAEIDEWLDLDWLGEALGRISQRGPRDHADSNEVQLTSIIAEFLTWWRERS